jgi:acyl-CoA synthetase (AMP-forming)/AMP-acid ligase II
LKEASQEFGKGLKANYNWRKGDVLALYTPNSVDTPAVIWGTIWAGGMVSPSNPTYTVDELAFQLNNAGAKILVTQISVLPTAIKAAEKVGIPTHHILILGDDRDPAGRLKHFTSVCDTSNLGRYRKARVNPQNDLAFLVYSSGTTGLPKGVMLSHRNIIANILQQVASDNGKLAWTGGVDGNGDRILAFLPFYHIYGKRERKTKRNCEL